MATKTYNWGDGSGDTFTLNYTGNAGTETATIESMPNNTASERIKEIYLQNTGTAGLPFPKTLTVKQGKRAEELPALDMVSVASSTNSEVYLRISTAGQAGRIEWGDGTTENFSAVAITGISHAYSATGNYNIKVFATKLHIAVLNYNTVSSLSFHNQKVKEVISMRGVAFNADSSYLFYSCLSLTTIPAGLFANCTAVTDFANCFYSCTSLTSIPAGLFANCTAVTDFADCFYYCSKLTSIPAGLFDNCTAVTNFYRCFYRCSSLKSIPAGLFDNCTAVTNFADCFRNCSSLNHAYNLTSANKKKLWERNGDADGVTVTSYSYFAYGASTIFRATIPTTWGGTMAV